MRLLHTSLAALSGEAHVYGAEAARVTELATLRSGLEQVMHRLDREAKTAWLKEARATLTRQLSDLRHERRSTQQFHLIVAYQTLLDQLDDYLYFRNFE